MEIVGRCFSQLLQLQAAIHITVPCGKVYELPIGFSFFGTAYSEPELGLTLSNKHPITIKPSFKKFYRNT
jgi:Asp-tRNA(Asn)/Glu-tRNA(Gln) amidotransferase A subunit family amidase